MYRRVYPLLMVSLIVTGISPAIALSQPKTNGTIHVKAVYKAKVADPVNRVPPFCSIHMGSKNRIFLESEDRRLFMCDAENGGTLWEKSIFDIGGDARAAENAFPYVQFAQLKNDEVFEFIFAGAGQGDYVQYDMHAHQITKHGLFPGGTSCGGRMERFPSFNRLILVPGGTWFPSVFVFDSDKKEIVFRLKPKRLLAQEFTSLAFSRDGKFAAATGDSVYVWDFKTRKRMNDAYQPSDDILKKWRPEGGYAPESCAFSADGKLLAVGTRGARLLVFDVNSGKMLMLEELQRLSYIEAVFFLGETGYILTRGSNELGMYDFPGRHWVDVDAFQEHGGFHGKFLGVGPVIVEGQSIFVCDYEGNLRRFDWSITPE